jgi:hypothetical protein
MSNYFECYSNIIKFYNTANGTLKSNTELLLTQRVANRTFDNNYNNIINENNKIN